MVTRIRHEGFRNSKVMETASALTDRIGSRLTGSPGMKKSNEWTRDKLAAWGLVNAHLRIPSNLTVLAQQWVPRLKSDLNRIQARELIELAPAGCRSTTNHDGLAAQALTEE